MPKDLVLTWNSNFTKLLYLFHYATGSGGFLSIILCQNYSTSFSNDHPSDYKRTVSGTKKKKKK